MPSIEDLIQVGFTPIQAKLLGGYSQAGGTVIASSTTETTIASFETPTQYLGLGRGFRVSVNGQMSNTTGSANGAEIKYYLGPSNVITDTIVSGLGSGNNRNVIASWIAQNQSSPTSYGQVHSYWSISRNVTASIAAVTDHFCDYRTSGVSTTSPTIVKVTITLSASSASLTWTTSGVFLEYL